MKAKLFYPCGIPKPIAMVLAILVLSAFCCSEQLFGQNQKKKPCDVDPIYCGMIKEVVCYGEAPDYPQPLIRLLEPRLNLDRATACLMFSADDIRFDLVLYAEIHGNRKAQSLMAYRAKTLLAAVSEDEPKPVEKNGFFKRLFGRGAVE